jgi:O-acetyl-ADP-ribose deacetylase (regulator of RNase III)
VKRRGGAAIEAAAVAQGPVQPGRAIVTTGGTLAAPYVVHAVAVGHDRRAEPDRLRSAIRAALAVAAPLQLHRLAFALIGVEHGVFTSQDAADILVDELTAADPSVPVESVVIATMHASETSAVAAALARHRTGVR